MSNSCIVCGNKMKGMLVMYPPSKDDPTTCTKCAMDRIQAEKQLDPIEREAVQVEREAQLELRSKAESLANGILIATTESIAGRRIMGHLGIARGGTVRAKNVINDIGADIKNIVGGELVAYTRLMADAREQALHRMKIDAVMLTADAVVGVKFSTSTIAGGAAEITAYGTAVTLAEGDSNE